MRACVFVCVMVVAGCEMAVTATGPRPARATAQAPSSTQPARTPVAGRSNWQEESARQDAEVAEQNRARSDVTRLGSGCDALAELERLAQTTHFPSAAEIYRRAVRERREAAVRKMQYIVYTLQQEAKGWDEHFFATSSDPSGGDEGQRRPGEEIATARSQVQSLACPGQDDAKGALAEVDTVAKDVDNRIEAEKKCRATPACLAARERDALCDLVPRRREVAADMATERRNPSGVVDLQRLHNDGEALQDLDQQIEQRRKNYTALARKPFSESICPKQ